MPMTPSGAAVIAGSFALVGSSWWTLVRDGKRLPRTWGWVFAGLGLLLVSTSLLLFLAVQYRLFRRPKIAANTIALLIQVRNFTRFYPTSAGLFGGTLGLFGRGASRWTILSSGALVGFLWYLFTVSLL